MEYVAEVTYKVAFYRHGYYNKIRMILRRMESMGRMRKRMTRKLLRNYIEKSRHNSGLNKRNSRKG
jgi:hypothetical protein